MAEKTPPDRYVLRIRDPRAHRIEVEATFAASSPTLDLAFPVWAPGSYIVREYERHVERLDAFAGDVPLSVVKTAKNRWRIETGGAPEVSIRYTLYAHELSVRTNHVDETHAFVTAPATFMYRVEGAGRSTVRIEAPAGWRIETELDASPEDSTVFHAPDLDSLMDSIFEIGLSERLSATAGGKPLGIAIWGEARFDRSAFLTDVVRIVETEAGIFGGLPYEQYLFVLHIAVGARGGLEHLSASACGASPHAFDSRTGLLEVYALLAHEHFHAWNVKRIRPAGLVPHRYEEENYTRLLWIAEGATAYYDWHVLLRAGLATREEYCKHLADRISQLESTPGRRVQSLEDASFDAWIKLYRADESTSNVTVSYYLKGEIVWAMIDLELRVRSGGRVGTDDVLRRFWTSGAPVPEDTRALFEDVGGVSVVDLFDAYVRGRGEVDVDAHLARAGLRLERTRKASAPTVAMGIRISTISGRLTVVGIDRDGPAERAGLSPGDEIIAWEGLRVDESTLRDRMSARSPGDEPVLTVFRRDRLLEVRPRLQEAPADELRIIPDPAASPETRAIGEAWLAAGDGMKTP